MIELFTDLDEGQLLARDISKIELGVPVEMDRNGLPILRLLELQVLRRRRGLRGGTGELREQYGSVHDYNLKLIGPKNVQVLRGLKIS